MGQEKRPIDLQLTCQLSDEDVLQRSLLVAAAVAEQDEIESRKRDAMKAFGDELKEVAQRMRVLSRAISSREEKRIVACQIWYHTPTQGTKSILRLDTGAIEREEPMTAAECQDHLFDGPTAAEPQALPLEDAAAADQAPAEEAPIAEESPIAMPAVEQPGD